MELIRYKVKGDTVMGVLIDYHWSFGVYYTIERLGKMIPKGSHWMQLTYSPKFKRNLPLIWSRAVHKNRGLQSRGNLMAVCPACKEYLEQLDKEAK